MKPRLIPSDAGKAPIETIEVESPGLATPPSKKWQRVRVNWKWLLVAFVVEAAIVYLLLGQGFSWAEEYGKANPDSPLQVWWPFDEHTKAWYAIVFAALLATAAECLRLGVVCLAATHRHRHARILAIIVACGCIFVSVKAVTQIYAEGFSDRIAAVKIVDGEIADAKNRLQDMQKGHSVTTILDTTRQKDIEAIDRRLDDLNGTLRGFGPMPKPHTAYKTIVTKDRYGRTVRQRVPYTIRDPWPGEATQTEIKKLLEQRAKLSEGATASAAEVRANEAAEKPLRDDISAKEKTRARAILASQLHHYAGMILWRSPSDITDTQLYAVMFFLVALAGLFTVGIASGVAYCSFTRHPATDEPNFDALKPPPIPVRHEVLLPASLERIMKEGSKP